MNRSIIIALSLFFLAGGQLLAQEPRVTDRLFAEMDINKNGSIDTDEYASRKRRGMPEFSFADANGDGALTADELHLVLQTLRRKRQGRSGGEPPRFEHFDQDGNGMIDLDEFTEVRGNRIRQRAEQGRPMKGLEHMMEFGDLDRDGNGTIDAGEFSAARAHHRDRQRH